MTGWLISELAALTQTPPRTLRYYRVLRLLPSLAFRGTSTRYQRVHLLRVLAIQRLKADRVALIAIRHRLEGMSEDELLAFVSERGVTRALAEALELPTVVADAVASRESDFTHASVTAPGGESAPLRDEAVVREGWRDLRLLPGLELRISGDASPLAHRLVREIYEDYVAERRAG